jgi:hypothetical protein
MATTGTVTACVFLLRPLIVSELKLHQREELARN